MDYEQDRFGSANIVSTLELKQAGMLDAKGISFGFDETQRHELFVPTDGSVALFGGAGCGKSAAAFANALIGGHFPGNVLCFDPRGEHTEVTTLSFSIRGYEVYTINPKGLLGLPQHRINPLDHLHLQSRRLIANAQKAALDFCPVLPGSKNSWPQEDAQRWLNDLILFDAERNNVASLPGVFELIMSIQGNLDAWCSYLEAMTHSQFPTVRNFAYEIMGLQKEGRDSFTAPLSVLQNAFSFMRDPDMQWTFGGSDVSTQWLPDPNRKMIIFVIWPIEYIDIQSNAIRQTIGSAIQNKLAQAGSAPVSLLIDEAGQLKHFPSLRELFTYGRGAGLVNNMVAWQETSQLFASFGDQANEIIGSAQVRVFKGVRTMQSAEMVSRLAGTMTLDYDQINEQSNAKRLKQQAAARMLSGGGLFETAADLRHYKQAETHRTKQSRPLLTPDEVLNLPPTQMVAFASGIVEGTILGHWINHFDRPDYAGKYLNNPYHSEDVIITTKWGQKKRHRVITEAVPHTYAHLPQYAGGTWKYVDGYRPA